MGEKNPPGYFLNGFLFSLIYMTPIYSLLLICSEKFTQCEYFCVVRQHHQASLQHHKVHLGALPDNGGQLHQVDE